MLHTIHITTWLLLYMLIYVLQYTLFLLPLFIVVWDTHNKYIMMNHMFHTSITFFHIYRFLWVCFTHFISMLVCSYTYFLYVNLLIEKKKHYFRTRVCDNQIHSCYHVFLHHHPFLRQSTLLAVAIATSS